MRTLVVYDSLYGNTERIARAIGSAIPGEVEVLRASEAGPALLRPFDLLVVGSPTQRGTATPAILSFVKAIPSPALEAASVATFDTRLESFWAALFGNAAGKLAGSVKRRGTTLVVPPEGFIVRGTEGPLKEGEVERASTWAKGLATAAAAGSRLVAS